MYTCVLIFQPRHLILINELTKSKLKEIQNLLFVFILYGRVVDSFAHSLFQFSILDVRYDLSCFQYSMKGHL